MLVRGDLMRHVDRGTAEVDRTYRSTMRVTFDAKSNMAYIHLTDVGDRPSVRHTEPLLIDLPDGQRRSINLDFDAFGMLTGIEVIEADQVLHPRLLATDK